MNGAANPSLVMFAQELLTHVVYKHETVTIGMYFKNGTYTIKAGAQQWEATTVGEVFDKFLRATAERAPSLTREQFAEMAPVETQPSEADQRLIDDLTKDGMTEFGKTVEQVRQDRRIRIQRALETELSDPIRSTSSILAAVRVRAQLPDLENTEIVEVWRSLDGGYKYPD